MVESVTGDPGTQRDLVAPIPPVRLGSDDGPAAGRDEVRVSIAVQVGR